MNDSTGAPGAAPMVRTNGDKSSKRVLASVVDLLCQFDSPSLVQSCEEDGCEPLPRREEVVELVRLLRSVLFPGYFGLVDVTPENVRFHVGAVLDKAILILREQVRRGLCFGCPRKGPGCRLDCEVSSLEVVSAFVNRLPAVKKLLETDVRAAYEGDPAATSPEETVFCYPGIRALISHRIAHELLLLGVPLLPRMISEFSHSRTGIDIHPGARIGESCFIDHGTGIVVGETCRIGKRVRIYQGVTLGAKSFPLDKIGNPIKGIDRHPIVEDDVIIYSGATILGRVTIGSGAVIGGNVWLTHSVPPGSRITQRQASQESFNGGAGI